MKPPFGIIFLFVCPFLVQTCLGQDMVSTYKPKNKTEKRIITMLKALPEVQRWYASGTVQHDIMLSPPDSSFKTYRFQVGLNYPDVFRTYFWLAIDPKTLQVYYEDFDHDGVQDITLQQWRHWRNKPEFQKVHKWVNGQIVVLQDKTHVKKKSSHP